MTHTINQSKHIITTPTGLYEANYRRLMRLVPELGNLQVNDSHCLNTTNMTLQILQQYKYTTVISLKQSLRALCLSDTELALKSIKSINMELRVCHDARLLEVISYQGQSPIYSSEAFPNNQMLQRDEKRQLNLFLKELLEKSLKTEYHREGAVKLSS
jgi:uncharacterized protein YqiB (DUF1249 family)